MNLINRLTSDTPTLFKKIRNIAIISAGVAGTILGFPFVVPGTILATVLTSIVTAGGSVAAISQAIKKGDCQIKEEEQTTK